jgi:hypothetical protein
MKCPKCEGEMEVGIVKTKGGAPEQEWGSKVNWSKIGVENAHNIETFRCTSCGYLESYTK